MHLIHVQPASFGGRAPGSLNLSVARSAPKDAIAAPAQDDEIDPADGGVPLPDELCDEDGQLAYLDAWCPGCRLLDVLAGDRSEWAEQVDPLYEDMARLFSAEYGVAFPEFG